MPVPIHLDDVNDTLKPWLGPLFLMSTPLSQELTYRMMQYSPVRENFDQLREKLEKHILVQINKLTHASMCIMVENYKTKRLTLRDIECMTDDLMGLMFDSLTPLKSNFEKLNEYALQHESLSALRVLYQKYASSFSEEEYAFMIQMIKNLYPKERYREWLTD
jgi:exonuclease VII large subunit